MITQELMIDVNDKGADTIFTRVGEEDTREIVITPISYVDGEPRPIIFDTENPTALFRMVKPDGTFVVKAMTRFSPESTVKFSVVLSGAMSQVAGVGYYDIRIYEEDSPDFIYTVQGQFQIDDDMITDSMIESVAEANGYVFPDDFLTSADLSDYVTNEELTNTLSDYATKEYVDDAIAEIPTPIHEYSTNEHVVGTWIDNKPVYERVILYNNSISDQNVHLIWEDSNIDEIITFELTYLEDGNYLNKANYNAYNTSVRSFGDYVGTFTTSPSNKGIVAQLTNGYNTLSSIKLIVRYTKSN